MTCGTGLLSAVLFPAAFEPSAPPLPALPLAALGLSVEDAGVLGLLEHPSIRHSALSATTFSMRVAFKETPSGHFVSV